MNFLHPNEVIKLKRKFSELYIDNIGINKQQKLSDNKKINKNIKVEVNAGCDIHDNFNACMMYNCPGIKSSRLIESIINKNINVDQSERHNFYS